MKRPVIWLLAVAAFLVFLALPFFRLDPGRIDERVLPDDLDARVTAETIQDRMNWSNFNPIQVAAPGLDHQHNSETPTPADPCHEGCGPLWRRLGAL